MLALLTGERSLKSTRQNRLLVQSLMITWEPLFELQLFSIRTCALARSSIPMAATALKCRLLFPFFNNISKDLLKPCTRMVWGACPYYSSLPQAFLYPATQQRPLTEAHSRLPPLFPCCLYVPHLPLPASGRKRLFSTPGTTSQLQFNHL